MCDTPLEVRFMLAETEGRARALAAGLRSEDAALAGAWRRITDRAGRALKASPLGGLISVGPAGQVSRRGGFNAAG